MKQIKNLFILAVFLISFSPTGIYAINQKDKEETIKAFIASGHIVASARVTKKDTEEAIKIFEKLEREGVFNIQRDIRRAAPDPIKILTPSEIEQGFNNKRASMITKQLTGGLTTEEQHAFKFIVLEYMKAYYSKIGLPTYSSKEGKALKQLKEECEKLQKSLIKAGMNLYVQEINIDAIDFLVDSDGNIIPEHGRIFLDKLRYSDQNIYVKFKNSKIYLSWKAHDPKQAPSILLQTLRNIIKRANTSIEISYKQIETYINDYCKKQIKVQTKPTKLDYYPDIYIYSKISPKLVKYITMNTIFHDGDFGYNSNDNSFGNFKAKMLRTDCHMISADGIIRRAIVAQLAIETMEWLMKNNLIGNFKRYTQSVSKDTSLAGFFKSGFFNTPIHSFDNPQFLNHFSRAAKPDDPFVKKSIKLYSLESLEESVGDFIYIPMAQHITEKMPHFKASCETSLDSYLTEVALRADVKYTELINSRNQHD